MVGLSRLLRSFRANLEILDELLGGDSRLLKSARKSASSDFLVIRNDATKRTPAQDDVTSLLANDGKAHSLKGGEALPAANPRQLREPLIYRPFPAVIRQGNRSRRRKTVEAGCDGLHAPRSHERGYLNQRFLSVVSRKFLK